LWFYGRRFCGVLIGIFAVVFDVFTRFYINHDYALGAVLII
jgi:hypothetical protein